MRWKLIGSALWLLAVASGAAVAAAAPPPPPAQFLIDGFIQDFTVDDPTDVLSGGKVKVNGITVIIPRNTLITMPASYATPQEYLATTRTLPPVAPFEAVLIGNRIGDDYIAALVNIFQLSVNMTSGIINYIDYDKAEMRVGGVLGDPMTGGRVQINDPIGRYARARSVDPRFQVDTDNPTIRSITGYPMCLPRVNPTSSTPDVLCPQTNRPIDPTTGKFKTIFTMAIPGTGPTDPTQQAPFEVGDFVEINGNLERDEQGDFISAWQILATLGIFTAPGTRPAYLAVDVVIMGAGGQITPAVDIEGRFIMKVFGFTTDPTRLINIFLVDVDPCTGAEKFRKIGTTSSATQPVLGRYRFTVDKNPGFLPPTRELEVQTNFVPGLPLVANGLVGNRWRQPMTAGEFIIPENIRIGDPVIPGNFEDFPFLVKGSGPYKGGPIMGQLTPFPLSPAPAPAVCP